MKLFEEEEFVKMCKEMNYNHRKTQIAVKLFVDKWGIKEVWKWLLQIEKFPPEYDSVKRMKYRMQNDIIEYLKNQQK